MAKTEGVHDSEWMRKVCPFAGLQSCWQESLPKKDSGLVSTALIPFYLKISPIQFSVIIFPEIFPK